MSLLSPEQFRLGLGATYAVLAQASGSRVTHWRMQTWDSASPAAWQQPLATIANWVAELKPRGARVSLALSAELAPLLLLPWRDDAVQAEQQALLAKAQFRRMHGEAAEHWKVVAQPSGYGQPWLASAVDGRLLQAATEQLRGATLVSVMPLPISLFNALRPRLDTAACWLLAPEPGRVTALHVRDASWSLLQTLPAADLQRESVHDLLRRETRLAGLPDLPATIYCASSKPAAASGYTAIDPGWLRSPTVPADSPLHLLGGRA